MTMQPFLLNPNPALDDLPPYVVGRPETGIDLVLDFNESTSSPDSLPPESNRYPDLDPPLAIDIADFLGVDRNQVLVTCGADDALQRAVSAVAAPGREVILPDPGYSMIRRYVTLSGAEAISVPWWEGDLPATEICAKAGDRTALVAVVSPANPTGAAATVNSVRHVLQELPRTLVLLDQAYLEFADPEFDLLETVLAHPNAVLIRTFSKAWAAAGLRVGFAVGHPQVIDWMRRVGLPFPVSRAAAAGVKKLLVDGPDIERIEGIRRQRQQLQDLLMRFGAEPWPSQGSFVLARFTDADFVWKGLASFGIAVRRFFGKPQLDGCLRFTLPGDADAYQRLEQALTTILSPEALLFDMDGVLADVSRSYRSAIQETARSFGVTVDADTIRQAKAAGNATNDWRLTHRLLLDAGLETDLAEVTERFESIYQGNVGNPGLRRHETPIISPKTLKGLSEVRRLAVVTGRPRADAERFLADHGLADLFGALVCMEDASSKPDPEPVCLALDRLGVSSAWMIGDTPDDMASALGAGVLPIGVPAPGEPLDSTHRTLLDAGAAHVLRSPSEITEVLP